MTKSDEDIHRIHDVGINYIGIAILGIAGKGKSQEHITETAKLFNEIKPLMLAPMSTSVAPGSELEMILFTYELFSIVCTSFLN